MTKNDSGAAGWGKRENSARRSCMTTSLTAKPTPPHRRSADHGEELVVTPPTAHGPL